MVTMLQHHSASQYGADVEGWSVPRSVGLEQLWGYYPPPSGAQDSWREPDLERALEADPPVFKASPWTDA